MNPSFPSDNHSNSLMKIVEECVISYPPESTNVMPTTYPLTFFDYPWLLFPAMQPLFFFQLPFNTHFFDFNSYILPRLKRSLSRALRYYFPLSGKLMASQGTVLTFFSDGHCGVKLSVAHSDADFDHLCSYLPRDVALFHQLVPSLPSFKCPSNNDDNATPLLALKITYFSSSSPGFSIGFSYHPVLCDHRSFSSFLHTWARISNIGHNNQDLLEVPPTFDRSVILDANDLLPILSKQTSDMRSIPVMKPTNDLLRATFIMSTTAIQDATGWIMSQCDKQNRPYPVLLSSYIVACAFVWNTLLRSSVNEAKAKGPMYFGFIAGGITRLNYQVPLGYFGNCVAFGRAVANREELLKEDGILAAADALAIAIKTLDTDVLGGAANWVSEWEVIRGSEEHLNVVGSPKVKLFETDFGWGRPTKIEEISLDVMKGISLTQSSDLKGGIEIGLVLNHSRMDVFSTLFNQGLHCFSSGGTF